MKKTYIFCVNRATDISLAEILYWNRPPEIDMKIVATKFYVQSEYYEWKKPKRLDCWLTETEANLMSTFFKEDFILCTSPDELRNVFNIHKGSVGIFPGRAPFIVKGLCENGAICISAVRDYFNRFLDVHFFYNNLTPNP